MTRRGLRIVAGEQGGRRILSAPQSRPTQERVREALFSRWQNRLGGVLFVDLFCGGGAVGLEALSRGVERCLFVDANPRSLEIVEQNALDLGVEDRCQRRQAELPRQWAQVDRFLASVDQPLLVYADPPYDFELYEELCQLMHSLEDVEEAAIEHSSRIGRAPWSPAEKGAEVEQETRRYGETAVTFL